jgi:magnesium-transporting ATPase (P-type)
MNEFPSNELQALTTLQAKQLQKKYGKNELEAEKKESVFLKFCM